MSNLQVASRLETVKSRILNSCQSQNRSEKSVCLLAVSKTKPLDYLVEAYQVGHRHFAENYAQELAEKSQDDQLSEAIWHFIGPLQSNKTRLIAENADWVHTIDRVKIAKRLSEQRPEQLPALNVLIQVNISADPAKAGIKPDQVEAFADQIAELPNLSLKGLMTITAANLTESELTTAFDRLKNCQSTLIKRHSNCTELSMGMSADFELAIASGATMIRVGSEIFGPRAPKPTN